MRPLLNVWSNANRMGMLCKYSYISSKRYCTRRSTSSHSTFMQAFHFEVSCQLLPVASHLSSFSCVENIFRAREVRHGMKFKCSQVSISNTIGNNVQTPKTNSPISKPSLYLNACLCSFATEPPIGTTECCEKTEENVSTEF